jgi:hypothetical protein
LKDKARKIMFIKNKIVRGALYLLNHFWHDAELHLNLTSIRLTKNVCNLSRWRKPSENKLGYLDAKLTLQIHITGTYIA